MARQFKLWEKRGIGGEWGDAITVKARSVSEAAVDYCKSKGYREPQSYTRDTFRVSVQSGARVFMHYIRVAKDAGE